MWIVAAPTAAENAPNAKAEASPTHTEPVEPETSSATEALRAGRLIFARRCGSCHPSGDADIGPTLRDKAWSPQAVRAQIRQGSEQMRPVPRTRLSESELPLLMSFLRSIGTVASPDARKPGGAPEEIGEKGAKSGTDAQ